MIATAAVLVALSASFAPARAANAQKFTPPSHSPYLLLPPWQAALMPASF
jgi:hypothetical protein